MIVGAVCMSHSPRVRSSREVNPSSARSIPNEIAQSRMRIPVRERDEIRVIKREAASARTGRTEALVDSHKTEIRLEFWRL
jgi:hypothetical protein